ncbi:hypothetical protein [Syntrophomonas erecta]
MTIRSIDMQVLVQKVGEVAKIQQSERLEHNQRQQENNQYINLQTAMNSKTVNKLEQNESALIQDKQESEHKKKKKFKQAKRKENVADPELEAFKDLTRGNTIDIKA